MGEMSFGKKPEKKAMEVSEKVPLDVDEASPIRAPSWLKEQFTSPIRHSLTYFRLLFYTRRSVRLPCDSLFLIYFFFAFEKRGMKKERTSLTESPVRGTR
jgi:hypothetical protein